MNPLNMKPGEDSENCLDEEGQEEEGLSVDHRHQHHTDKCDNLQHVPESSQLLTSIKYYPPFEFSTPVSYHKSQGRTKGFLP